MKTKNFPRRFAFFALTKCAKSKIHKITQNNSYKSNSLYYFTLRLISVVVFCLNFQSLAQAQTELQIRKTPGIDRVKLQAVFQRFISDQEIQSNKSGDDKSDLVTDDFLGGYDVVVVGNGDDLVVRFRLENNGHAPIYYLVENYMNQPAGFILHKNKDKTNWQAATPAWGREGSLTGDGYKWLGLLPGKAIEFEYTDLSGREGEHAASIVVNNNPEQKGRKELISDTYLPLKAEIGKFK